MVLRNKMVGAFHIINYLVNYDENEIGVDT